MRCSMIPGLQSCMGDWSAYARFHGFPRDSDKFEGPIAVSGFPTVFVYPDLASCATVAPASIHEILEMRSTIAVCNSSFLLIFRSARTSARLHSVSKTQGYAEFLSCACTTSSAHLLQYLSITDISFPIE